MSQQWKRWRQRFNQEDIVFESLRALFFKPIKAQNVADQRFGVGAARRVAIALDDEVSRLCSYRGRLAIVLFDVMPPGTRSGSLVIDSAATGAVHGALPPPAEMHDELLVATFERIADELGYIGRIGISFSDYAHPDGYPFRLEGVSARSIEDGSLGVFTVAA